MSSRARSLRGAPYNKLKLTSAHPFLRATHVAAAAVQYGTAITLLVLLVATDWLDYETALGTTYLVAPGTYDFWHWFNYRSGWILMAMCTLTGVAHTFIATFGWQFYLRWAVKRSVHVVSWLEYCVTATLMTWVLLALAGTRDVWWLLIGALLIGLCNVLGLVIELALYGLFVARNKRYDWREGPTALAALIAMGVAWVLALLPWLPVFTQVGASYTFGTENMPWYVLASTVQTFVLYANFGFVFMWEHLLMGARRQETYTTKFAFMYVLLSFVSKQGLTWILVSGLIAQRA